MADIIPNAPELAGKLPKPVFHDPNHHIKIYQGDCLEILAAIPADCVDLIFADPPYFLSNDGITCHAGKMVSVNKGAWDKSKGPDLDHEFNRAWLADGPHSAAAMRLASSHFFPHYYALVGR